MGALFSAGERVEGDVWLDERTVALPQRLGYLRVWHFGADALLTAEFDSEQVTPANEPALASPASWSTLTRTVARHVWTDLTRVVVEDGDRPVLHFGTTRVRLPRVDEPARFDAQALAKTASWTPTTRTLGRAEAAVVPVTLVAASLVVFVPAFALAAWIGGMDWAGVRHGAGASGRAVLALQLVGSYGPWVVGGTFTVFAALMGLTLVQRVMSPPQVTTYAPGPSEPAVPRATDATRASPTSSSTSKETAVPRAADATAPSSVLAPPSDAVPCATGGTLASLAAAYDANDAAAVLAEVRALDADSRQAVLGRARVNRYGVSAPRDAGGHAELTVQLLLLVGADHPKVRAMRRELTQLHISHGLTTRLRLPGQFGEFQSLEQVTLREVDVDGTLDLRGMPALKRVTLTDCAVGAIALPPSATHLELGTTHGHETIAVAGEGLTDLLVGQASDLTTLRGIDALPKLASLTLSNTPRYRFGAHIPSLRALKVHRAPQLQDLATLRESTHVSRLALSQTAATDLRGLTLPSHAELQLSESGITSLAGLPPIDTKTLKIEERALKSLHGIEALTELEELTLKTPALVDLAALSRADRLTHLELVGVPIADLSALRGCGPLRHLVLRDMAPDLSSLPTTLRSLDLRGCAGITDVAPLTQQADLRALALEGTRVNPAELPTALAWATSFEASVDVSGLARRRRPSAGADAIAPGIFAGLAAPSAEVVAATLQGLDRDTFDALLIGVRVRDGHPIASHPALRELPNSELITTALLLHAPAELPVAASFRRARFTFTPGEQLTGRWPLLASILEACTDHATVAGVHVVGSFTSGGPATLSLKDTLFDDPGSLARLTRVRDLKLASMQVSGIQLPASVRSLALEGTDGPHDLSGLEGVGLTSLEVARVRGFESLEGVQRLPALTWLSLRGVDVTSVAVLADRPRMRAVTLSGCHALVDLTGIPPTETLTIEKCAFTSLRGLGASTDPATLVVDSCDALTSLDGLEAWTGLTHASVRRCDRLTDVRALDGHPSLVELDVRRNPSLTTLQLARCPVLRKIKTADTPVDTSTTPPSVLWLCADDSGVRVGAQTLHAETTPAPAADVDGRSQRAVLKLLRARDVELIDQGLELVRGLDDAALWDALLDGAELVTDQEYGTLLRSPKFTTTFAAYALLGLVTAAPDTCTRATALRASLVDYRCKGSRGDADQRPFAPAHLQGLFRLQSVTLDRVGPIVHRGPAPSLPTLVHVRLIEVTGKVDLAWLAEAPALNSLAIAYTSATNLDALRDAPNLAEVSLRHANVADLSALLTIPKLRKVSLFDVPLPTQLRDALAARGVTLEIYR